MTAVEESVTAGTSSLRPLLEAGSVAVVGASARPGSVGAEVMHQLLQGGFDGPVYPINPRYREVAGHRCLPTLADIGRPVDLVILAVGNAALETQLRETVAIGAGAATIFASAYEHEPGDPSLLDRLRAVATEAGMVVCGGNGMGFVHVEHRLRASAYSQPLDLEPGPVTFLTHSGSLFTAMLHNRRHVRFNLAVSTGQELVTTMADYLLYALDQPSTRVVALFLETVRDPRRFLTALRLARERDIAVVALTVGRHDETRGLVTAHSGALAGDDGAYEAVFDAYGVHRVTALDELLDTLSLFTAGRRAAPGGLAALHDSGGERAHLADLALDGQIPLAVPGARTRERLAALLDAGLPATNPLDAWGSSRNYHEIFLACGQALLDDPDTAGLVFCVDLPDETDEDSYPDIARALKRASEKPFGVLSNVSGAINDVVADGLRQEGIPVLEGTTTGLAAFGHLLAHRDHRARPPIQPPEPAASAVAERWRQRLSSRSPWSESEALALVADFGIDVVEQRLAEREDDVLAAARGLGWPVAVKTAMPGISHKSDQGGVQLSLTDDQAVRTAYRALRAGFGPAVSVARMVPPGVELAIGVVRDPAFGPLVVVGAGGLLVEVLRDRRVALPPLDAVSAVRLLDGLKVSRLLTGVRGAPAADMGAIARALVRLSVLALTFGDELAALDVNPLICGPHGCVAVDALVEPIT